MLLAVLLATALADAPAPDPIDVDRTLSQLTSGQGEDGQRAAVRQAGELLGEWTIQFAGVPVDGPRLIAMADAEGPFVRVVREDLGRAVDVEDFIYLLDDVLEAGAQGRRGEAFDINSGRARSAGALVHTDDVFKNKPRRYGAKKTLAVDQPKPQTDYPEAQDGDLLGPEWTMRYRNPSEYDDLLGLLRAENPDFAERVDFLLTQLKAQGAEVYLTSSIRSQHRGYLMWGAFILSRCESAAKVDETIALLERRNREWTLNTPIEWRHPDGWAATVEAARLMADAYDVVYATEKGARSSNHYGNKAVDFVVIDLPRNVTLAAPNDEVRVFDLSAPEQTRDLSLSPEMISWIEKHYGFSKLKGDYPHWNDAR